jgi:acylphosphatase
MRVARHFVVTGRVQGVGFRMFVQEAALGEGVCGWVNNRPDGSVEALVEGEAEAVDRVARRIRTGPPRARVEHVRETEQVPTERTTGFQIGRGTMTGRGI